MLSALWTRSFDKEEPLLKFYVFHLPAQLAQLARYIGASEEAHEGHFHCCLALLPLFSGNER